VYLPVNLRTEEDMEVREAVASLAAGAGCVIIEYGSEIVLEEAEVYLSAFRMNGVLQNMAEVTCSGKKLLYLSRGRPEAFEVELEGAYNGVILGTHGSGVYGDLDIPLASSAFGLYTAYVYRGALTAPAIPPSL